MYLLFLYSRQQMIHMATAALVMAGALRNAKLPVELHLLSTGGHGYGLRPGKIAAETWPVLAEKMAQSVLK